MRALFLLAATVAGSCTLLQASGICVDPDTPQLACIYTNFGPGQAYQAGIGLTPGYTAVAVPFVPTASWYLADLEVAVYRGSSDVPDSVRYSIYDSLGGLPNSPLESFNLTGLGIIDGEPVPGTITVSSVSHPLLSSGTQYWVVMDNVNPGDVVWNFTTLNVQGDAAVLAPTEESPAHWSLLPGYVQGAVALDGTPGAPEPGTFLLLGVGLIPAALFARRRKSSRM